MSNVLEIQPNSKPPFSETDLRSVRESFARALGHLARGERNAAALDCKQVLLQMPDFAPAHSLAGLLALLNGDLKTARVAYGRAAGDLRKVSPERERLIALRVLQTDETAFDINEFVTDLSAELQHLHDSGEAAFQARLQPQTAVAEPVSSSFPTPAFSVPSSVAAASGRAESSADFRDELKRRRQLSRVILLVAAIIAALLSFVAVRALFWSPSETVTPKQQPVPAVESKEKTEATTETEIETPAETGTETQDWPSPSRDGSDSPSGSTFESSPRSTPESTPAAASSEAARPALTPAPPSTPATAPAPSSSPNSAATREAAPAASAPESGPRIPPILSPTPRAEPAPAARELPGQIPGSASNPVPRALPARPAPPAEEPLFPPMPRPRVTLPSAGHPPVEFPRVIPDGD